MLPIFVTSAGVIPASCSFEISWCNSSNELPQLNSYKDTRRDGLYIRPFALVIGVGVFSFGK